jgi:hypothetical protein
MGLGLIAAGGHQPLQDDLFETALDESFVMSKVKDLVTSVAPTQCFVLPTLW